MDWVDRQQNYKGLYGSLQLLQGSHFDNFQLKTLKLGWVTFHSLTFQLKRLDFRPSALAFLQWAMEAIYIRMSTINLY